MNRNKLYAVLVAFFGNACTLILMSKTIPQDHWAHMVALLVMGILNTLGYKATTDASNDPSPAQEKVIATKQATIETQQAAIQALSAAAPAVLNVVAPPAATPPAPSPGG